MHRFLAVLIALLLAGGVASLVVKGDESDDLVLGPAPTPSDTFTPPASEPTETPTEPSGETPGGTETPAGTETETPAAEDTMPSLEGTGMPEELALTGSRWDIAAAVMILGAAILGGLVVRRAARRPA